MELGLSGHAAHTGVASGGIEELRMDAETGSCGGGRFEEVLWETARLKQEVAMENGRRIQTILFLASCGVTTYEETKYSGTGKSKKIKRRIMS